MWFLDLTLLVHGIKVINTFLLLVYKLYPGVAGKASVINKGRKDMKIQLLYFTAENTEVRELEQRGLSEAKAQEDGLACVTEGLPLYHHQHSGRKMRMRRKNNTSGSRYYM